MDYLLALILSKELTKIPIVVTFHLPEENISFSMLWLLEKVIIEQLKYLSTYGGQLIFNFLSVYLDQIEVFVSLNKITNVINVKTSCQ